MMMHTTRTSPASEYDALGNLTNIAYPASGTVRFAYDALNRMTNMVDAVGTTRYTYDAAGQLLTEDGPFTSDTVTNTYSNRRRVALSLQQPTATWTNGFGWDLAGRLTNVTSAAGSFSYAYAALYSGCSGRLVQQLGLPGGATITNSFDPVARVLATVLQNSGGSTLDSALYSYNTGSQRTAYTNAAGAYVLYSYDPIGQLKVADSSTNSEDRGYAYDAAWNLNYLTNSGTHTFTNNSLNELTWIGSTNSFEYDNNGNLTNANRYGLPYTYEYDDENRLTLAQLLYQDDFGNWHGWRTTFQYDGLGRLRRREEWTPGTADGAQERGVRPLDNPFSWEFDHGVDYIYDSWRVIQERDTGGNLPLASYTRGNDLSGSLEGAGGIGGLLARSSGYSSGNWTSHSYYHADGNGNITCLIDTNQSVVATYRYDPFGNTLSKSGSLADANTYRFSSKEILTNSLMYYYGYRFYDPTLQRWINRDPLWSYPQSIPTASRSAPLGPPVRGGLLDLCGAANLYDFVRNDPVNHNDPYGLGVNDPPPCVPYPECLKHMPPHPPPKPPPYWYQCLNCSKSTCESIAQARLNSCLYNSYFACEEYMELGPEAYLGCVASEQAACSLAYLVTVAGCQLCKNP